MTYSQFVEYYCFIREKGPIIVMHVSNILINLKMNTASNNNNNVATYAMHTKGVVLFTA